MDIFDKICAVNNHNNNYNDTADQEIQAMEKFILGEDFWDENNNKLIMNYGHHHDDDIDSNGKQKRLSTTEASGQKFIAKEHDAV